MTSSITNKIKLRSIDELLGVPEQANCSVLIETAKIDPFKNHPFKVLDDDRMTDLVESIKINGVLNPVILRSTDNGRYEMISGHRRLHASKIIGMEKIPAQIKELSDDEATIIMVDSNIQREELLPSEKAFAFKMRLEAISRQGFRSDKSTSRLEVKKLSADLIGEQHGVGARQVQRYVRLTYLIPELLDYVDIGKVGVNIAVDISYFDNSIQQWIYEYVKDNGFVKPAQITALKSQTNLNHFSQHAVISVMNEVLPMQRASGKVSLSEKKLDKYFPSHYSASKREQIILSLLQEWKNNNSETLNEG